MLHLKDLIPRLLQRWHWIVLGLGLGLAIGVYAVWRAVPQYEAQATVLVKDSQLDALGKLDATEIDLRSQAALATLKAQLTTFALCKVIAQQQEVRRFQGSLYLPDPKTIPFFSQDQEDLAKRPAPEVGDLANMIRKWVVTSNPNGTRFITVSVTHSDPELALVLANQVVDRYMEQRKESRSGGHRDDLEYLLLKVKDVRTDLQLAENVLASYTSPLDAEKALTVAEASVDALSLVYGPKHPKMSGARGTQAQAEGRLVQGMRRAATNTLDAEYWEPYQNLVAQLAVRPSPGSGSEAPAGHPIEHSEVLTKVRELLTSRRSVLETDIESLNTLYTTMVTQIEELQFKTGPDGEEGGSVRNGAEADVIPHEPARVSELVSPNKPRILIQAAALGLFAGLGLAFLFQALDNKFHTAADVEAQLGLPVLAAIAEFDLEALLKEEEKKRAKSDFAPSPRHESWSPFVVFRSEGANTHFAEMFRVLRTSVSLLGPAKERKVTLVTSALPAEGKTMVACNFAVALAQQGLRTLLIDFDLRKPSTHKMFGLEKDAQPGIVDLLAGKVGVQEVCQPHSGQENLAVILAGPKAPNPGELLIAERLQTLLEALRKHFDHIVLDSAPILAVPDSRILAPLVDNLTLVVRAEATPRGAVKRAVEVLGDADCTPEGVVFNGYQERRFMIGKNYSYGYYQYGKYGYGKSGYGAYGSVYGEEEED